MARYLFGFQTHSIHETGTFLYAGDGDGLLVAAAQNAGRFTRLGELNNPVFYSVAPPKVARKPVVIDTAPEPVNEEFPTKKQRNRKTTHEND